LSATEIREESPPAPEVGEAMPSTPEESVAASDVTPTPDEVIPSDDPRPIADAHRPEEPAAAAVPGATASGRARGTGAGALLAAGVIGGVIGAGAALLTEGWWRPRVMRVDDRLAQVERRLAQAPNAVAPLEGRVTGIETQNKALAEGLNALKADVERAAKAASARAASPPAPAPGGTANVGALDDLAKRLAVLETQAQERASAGADAQGGIKTLQEQVKAAAAAAQAMERRLAEHDQRLGVLSKQVPERGPEAMAASLRLTLAGRLIPALEDGAPLAQILAVLRRFDAKPDNLKPLEPYAASGAPTGAALAREFRPIGQQMIVQSRGGAGDWDERLWRMLDKVVTVRAVGDEMGTDPASLVARIEDALSRDAFADAAAVWDALPEPARAKSQEWGAKLKQRAAAEAASRRIYAEALSALEASTR
jgi:hypothetical protein